LKRVVIIGGGLAGLITAIQVARAGVSCAVFEKKAFPFHRVCGEYISNEVVPFLTAHRLFPAQFEPPQIRNFMLSSVSGKYVRMPLDLGGFGISRYTFDNFLYEQAVASGVEFYTGEEVQSIRFVANHFEVQTARRSQEVDLVVGAYGKRSKLDHVLKRPFIQRRSPYLGVKYHLRTQHPSDLIALHNFPGGYCGMSNIEEGKTTLCYLSHRDSMKKSGDIHTLEERFLYRNPLIQSVFENASFLFEKPEVINEISFETKEPVVKHVLMAGDAAGMIAPLCGNGMAMAIRSGKILGELVIRYTREPSFTREMLEQSYIRVWNQHFKDHLWRGRQIQKLFGNDFTSRLAVGLALYVRPLADTIMRNTHGDPF
jgi:flavin-dependent dehydrogenase